MWNRLRYTFWAPWYDRLVALPGFDEARRRSIQGLALRPGDRVLIVGVGTGLDLVYMPRDVSVTAVDVTPAMLGRLQQRAKQLGMHVNAHCMDARRLAFDADTFDAVVLHLVLAVMPQPEQGLREAERVMKRGGRIAVFDKFLGDHQRASIVRRLANLVILLLFSDLNRRLGPIVKQTQLVVEGDDPVALGGMFRIIRLRKADAAVARRLQSAV